MFVKGKGRGFFIAFGIVTPDASEGAALEKNAGTYSVTVVYTIFLYIEYNSHFYAHLLSLSFIATRYRLLMLIIDENIINVVRLRKFKISPFHLSLFYLLFQCKLGVVIRKAFVVSYSVKKHTS